MRIISIVVLTGFASILLHSPSASAGDTSGGLPHFSLFDTTAARSGAAASQQQPRPAQAPAALPRMVVHPSPMSAEEKWKYYLKSTYGPKSIAYSLFGAGIKQAQDSVPEWGQGMEGYSKRFASGFGQKAIKRSVQHGLGGLLGEAPRYFASLDSGIWPRTLHAAKEILVTHKDSGGTRIAYTRFVGTFTGVYVSRQWRPENDQTVGQYFSATGTSLGIDAAKNVFKEFWPDIKSRLPFLPF